MTQKCQHTKPDSGFMLSLMNYLNFQDTMQLTRILDYVEVKLESKSREYSIQ